MPETLTSIGIDIGGTNIRVARVTPEGAILAHAGARSPSDPADVLPLLMKLIAEIDHPSAKSLGVGVPGRVDFDRRAVLSGGFLNLASIDLAKELETLSGRPVVVDNDANMALVAEMAIGGGRGLQNVTMLTIGTGIGGASFQDGQVFRGTTTAGQLGHMTINVNGRQCVCGRIGCVETESSGTALQRHLSEAGFEKGTNADALWAIMEGGNALARQVFIDWATPLRSAIDTLSATLDPQLVLLGGGAGHAAVKALELVPTRSSWYDCKVAAAELGDNAGVIGAALAGLRNAGQSGTLKKRAILVNGVPASGKSSVGRELARRTGWPFLSLDTVKTPFLNEIKEVDRLFNRRLGIASYEAIWSLMRDFPEGTTIIVDAWFGFQPLELLEQHLRMAGVDATVELWCHASGESLAKRYESRLVDRPIGHPGASYIPELMALNERARPVARGPVYDIDTDMAVDHGTVCAWVKSALMA